MQICKGTGRSVWQPSGLPIEELFIIVISTPFWGVLHQVISAKSTWSFLKRCEPPTSYPLFQRLKNDMAGPRTFLPSTFSTVWISLIRCDQITNISSRDFRLVMDVTMIHSRFKTLATLKDQLMDWKTSHFFLDHFFHTESTT